MAVCLPASAQAVEPGNRLGLGVAGERHEQQRLRVAVQDRAERSVFDLLRDSSSMVRSISSTATGWQASASCVASIAACADLKWPTAITERWRGHQLDGRLQGGDQGAFGAHHEFRQIEPADPASRSSR